MTALKTADRHRGLLTRDSGMVASKTKLEALDQPSSAWNSLAFSTRQRDPFCCSSTWQLSFHEGFSPGRRLFVNHSGDSLIAFAEKAFSTKNVYLTPIEPLWFFGANILGVHGFDLLDDTLADFEKIYHPYFPKILVGAIAPRGKAFNEIKRKFSDRFELRRHTSGIQCGASLAGGLDGYLSRRSGNHRKKLKKFHRKATEAGVKFERHSPSSAVEAKYTYARMLAIENTSWKGSLGSGIIERKFYAVLLRRLAASQAARVIFVTHENKDIGFIFGGMARNVYRGQQFSYDDEWDRYSIGNLLQIEQIKWLCEEGATRYDMGPLLDAGMGYKSHWTEKRFRIETWLLEKK